MRVVVLMLVGVFLSPLAAADDYAGLSAVGHDAAVFPALAMVSSPSFVGIAEDGEPDGDETFCSCVVCILGLDGIFRADVPVLQNGGMAAYLSKNLFSSSYRSEVYRPPIG